MPGYTPYVIGEVFGFVVLILTNIALIYGAMKNNRSFIMTLADNSINSVVSHWILFIQNVSMFQ